ncbi:MAG TPA: YkuS family protein [Clostridia bacterium]|nr:YkuS family protein [Clostridia bacterium]
MIIAIQRGMENIKVELENRGYKVFYIGENKTADAVIYTEADAFPYYEVNNIPSAAASSIDGNTSYGALLVNATNKSMEDIIRIIEKRTYSPLF